MPASLLCDVNVRHFEHRNKQHVVVYDFLTVVRILSLTSVLVAGTSTAFCV